MRLPIRSALLLMGALGLAGCDLDVQNPNDPETERVLSSPRDVESLAGAQYKRWHEGLYTNLGNVNGMASVQSFENYSALANNCMNQRNPIPRPANNNQVGNGCGEEQVRVYAVMNEVVRTASNVLKRISDPSFNLGTTTRNKRAEAIVEFARGLALGYAAMIYDSSAIISVGMSTDPAECLADPFTGACTGRLKGYMEVADSALVGLDRAIAATQASAAAGAFEIPQEWIPTTSTLNSANFIRLIRSYKARIRANVARTPAERAAVNWGEVIADASNGITADHDNITNRTTGPFYTWASQWHTFATWHQMTPFIIGMADTSGSYAAWIAQPVNERGNTGSFFMVTPDQRFPQGNTRAQQQADFAITSCSAGNSVCKRRFVNRPTGNDQFQGPGWGWSNYDFVRWYPWATSGDGSGARNGPIVFFSKAENDMLEAEGQIRLNTAGSIARAATLIDRTRVTNGGLPPLSGVVTAVTQVVPGGAACVPKVPVGPTYTTLACGNILEAMKWEKRIEGIQTGFASWFLDSRGWGDLVEGTPTHWAVPYQDLQARERPATAVYSTGGFGLGNTGTAAKGTYGW